VDLVPQGQENHVRGAVRVVRLAGIEEHLIPLPQAEGITGIGAYAAVKHGHHVAAEKRAYRPPIIGGVRLLAVLRLQVTLLANRG